MNAKRQYQGPFSAFLLSKMAMYEFTTEELVELLGHYTTVTLNNSKKTALEGYLYTIDPNSRNVVLYTDQETVQVIMNHSIQHITSNTITSIRVLHFVLFIGLIILVDKERKFDIELIDMKLQYQQNNCKYASKDMLDKRRRDLIQHLETVRTNCFYK